MLFPPDISCFCSRQPSCLIFYLAEQIANANEYTLLSAESALDVRTIGALAPAITAPTFAFAK
jgi:hypothetical protein